MVEVTHLAGRAICVFHEDDVETISGLRISDLVNHIRDQFDFDVVPYEENQQSDDQLIFRDGIADLRAMRVQIGELRLFNNMVIVQCKRTEFADEVMSQIFQSIAKKFGFPLEFPSKTYYICSLSVKFQSDIQGLFSGIDTIINIVNSYYDQTDYAAHDIRLTRMSFGGDPAKKLKDNASRDLIIERRANAPFEDNRFFVEAPFASDRCESLVEEIEKLV